MALLFHGNGERRPFDVLAPAYTSHATLLGRHIGHLGFVHLATGVAVAFGERIVGRQPCQHLNAIPVVAIGVRCVVIARQSGEVVSVLVNLSERLCPCLLVLRGREWQPRFRALHHQEKQLGNRCQVLTQLIVDNGEFAVEGAGKVVDVVAPLVVRPSFQFSALNCSNKMLSLLSNNKTKL